MGYRYIYLYMYVSIYLYNRGPQCNIYVRQHQSNQRKESCGNFLKQRKVHGGGSVYEILGS